MPIAFPSRFVKFAGSLLLWAGLFTSSWALPWDVDLKLGRESYKSDSLQADTMAWAARWQVRHLKFGSMDSGLSLSASENLYDRLISGRLSLAGGGDELLGSLHLSFSRRDPGKMSVPLLRFDPDAILLIEEQEQSSLSLGSGLNLDWLADLFNLHLDLDASALRYPEPDSIISDRGSLDMKGELSAYLPTSLQLDLLMDLGSETFMQRPASDRRRAALGLRMSRMLGERWNLRAECMSGRHWVQDIEGISSYERPGGEDWKTEISADRFASHSDLSLRAEYQRENWDVYEGYYRPGSSWLTEMLFARRIDGQARGELVIALSAFDPDSSSAETWTLDRGRERRFELNLILGFMQESELPLELGFFGEESRLGSVQDDRFRILQTWLNLRWNWNPARQLSARLSLDEYLSQYQDEPSQRDLGMSGSVEFRCRWSSDWTLLVRGARSRRFSFLEEGELIEDWEISLGFERRTFFRPFR